jgi:PAS domain S-box-containing protein
VAQEKLARSEAQKAAILEASLDCVIAMDAAGLVVSWNGTAERTFGYSREEVIGRELAELIMPPRYRSAHRAGLARYLATGEQKFLNRRVEISALRSDGTEFPIELTIIRIPGESPALFTGFVRDITEHKQLEEARERFIGILGHDLRNPLAAISTGASLLLQSEDVPEHRMRTVRRISSSTDRMTRMIHELLDFTRGRLGGGIPVAPRPTALQTICLDVLDELESGTPGLKFELEAVGDTHGEWDPERMAQVVSNLASNAAQHSRPGAPVRVSMDGSGSEVILRINNAATCPPEENLDWLFEPFRRAAVPHDVGRPMGLGLGLYITKEIVRAHGGSIQATCSEAEGFTVAVRLPRRPRPVRHGRVGE